MNTDFPGVTRLVASSTLGRLILAVASGLRAAAATSFVATSVVRARQAVAAQSDVVRIRMAGLFLGTAVLTQWALLVLVPPFVRPAAPLLLRLELLGLALVLIVAAPQIARARKSRERGRGAVQP